jgi:hypothetical protein
MKQKPIPEPTEELKAKCDAENQFSNLDRLFRAVITVPKADIIKADAEEKRQKKARKKKPTT